MYGRLSTSTPLCHTQTYLALKSGVYGVLEIKVLNETRGDESVDKRVLIGVDGLVERHLMAQAAGVQLRGLRIKAGFLAENRRPFIGVVFSSFIRVGHAIEEICQGGFLCGVIERFITCDTKSMPTDQSRSPDQNLSSFQFRL